jgi:hypothetical protein
LRARLNPGLRYTTAPRGPGVWLLVAALTYSGSGCGAVLASSFDTKYRESSNSQDRVVAHVQVDSDPSSAWYRVGEHSGTTPSSFTDSYTKRYRISRHYEIDSLTAWVVGTVLDVLWLGFTTYVIHDYNESPKTAYAYAPIAAFLIPGHLTWDLATLARRKPKLTDTLKIAEPGQTISVRFTKEGYQDTSVWVPLPEPDPTGKPRPVDVKRTLTIKDAHLRRIVATIASRPLAGNSLGHSYPGGGESLDENPARARQYFDQACQAGSAEGCYNFALMLARGEGGPRNPTEAWGLFGAACARGLEVACAHPPEAADR